MCCFRPQGTSAPSVMASAASADSADSSEDAQRPAFLATESVMQQRTYFGGVMVAYVLGLAVAFAVGVLGFHIPTFTSTSAYGQKESLTVSRVLLTNYMLHAGSSRCQVRAMPAMSSQFLSVT